MLYHAPSAEIRDTFHQGTNRRAYEMLGAHPCMENGVRKWHFCVWAPNARHVALIGEFNQWDKSRNPMEKQYDGTWEIRLTEEELWRNVPADGYPTYKYAVWGRDDVWRTKADPFGFFCEVRPRSASRLIDLEGYHWDDGQWMKERGQFDPYHSPVNIYELHAGSWRRHEDGSFLSYTELADQLIPYVKEMGYTHIELLPVTEHPLDDSWGYQCTGYFAPTSRFGTPEDFMWFVNHMHQNNIAVILDWVPAHFCKDEQGLYEFDGTCCYELSDPEMNEHPDWTTRIFDFGKPEVKSFLISNAIYWLKQFHIDGLRVDAVSSMLYLDYSRAHYKPNKYGGRENLEAIDFIRQLNQACFAVRKGTIMVAEESHAFPMVTWRPEDGGLGFNYKWNMGWMNDTLKYFKEDPINRKYHHDKMTFSMAYAFSENFVLPLSHDEVVHMKGSLIEKQPGDYFWKFAGLRLLRGYQMVQPGKKLLFMGGEIGQFREWKYDEALDWTVLDYEMHQKLVAYNRDLNHFYKEHAALWADDCSWNGYQWIQPDDNNNSVLAFRRIDPKTKKELIVILNMTPVTRDDYVLGLPQAGTYEPVFCSDDWKYGGTGSLPGAVEAYEGEYREYQFKGNFHLAPMSLTIFQKVGRKKKN